MLRSSGSPIGAGCPATASAQALRPFHPLCVSGQSVGHMALGWTDGHQAELREAGPRRPPSPTGWEKGRGAPGNRASRGLAAQQEGDAGDLPHVGHRRPPLPHTQGRPHQLHASIEEFSKPGAGRGKDESPFALRLRCPAQGSAPPGRLTWKQQVPIPQRCG